MKISHYIFFTNLISCFPTDCYTMRNSLQQNKPSEKFELQTNTPTNTPTNTQTDSRKDDVQTNTPTNTPTDARKDDVQTNVQTGNTNSKNGVTSKATFYFRVGENVQGCPDVQTFNDGNRYGPCSEGGLQGVKYTENSKYWAAIANGGSRCGDTITVNYGGNSLQLKVMDDCPACAIDNHVDMSLEALIELTGSKENACAINTVLPMITWY